MRENFNCSGRDLRRIANALDEQVEHLCRAWERIHGVE
jgi:hypothetical protein